MKHNIWDKRIPTLFGILLIVLGIGATVFLAQKNVTFKGFAVPSELPKNIRISNVTDTSFTVSFTTDADVISSINFGKDKNLGQTALDERDRTGTINSHTLHSITVKNLASQTTYYFSIISGQI